jgi:hypothetical protein
VHSGQCSAEHHNPLGPTFSAVFRRMKKQTKLG